MRHFYSFLSDSYHKNNFDILPFFLEVFMSLFCHDVSNREVYWKKVYESDIKSNLRDKSFVWKQSRIKIKYFIYIFFMSSQFRKVIVSVIFVKKSLAKVFNVKKKEFFKSVTIFNFAST